MNITDDYADALVGLGELAMTFSRIRRTSVYHPNGGPAESDSDHTVMLGWIAPGFGAQLGLDAGLIAEFSLIHDAVEVYAGDTPTLRIDEEGLAEKELRELNALHRIRREFVMSFPWFVHRLEQYEDQVLPEARFVRAVDKCLPKIVHLLDNCRGLREVGMDMAEFLDRMEEQNRSMKRYAGEWPDLLRLHTLLVGKVAEKLREAQPLPHPSSTHQIRVSVGEINLEHFNCPHENRLTCPFTLAMDRFVKSGRMELAALPLGVHELSIDGGGELEIEEG